MHIMISQVMPVRETSLHSVVAIRRAIGALGGFKEVLEELPDVADSSQVRLPCCVFMVAHVVLRVPGRANMQSCIRFRMCVCV